MAAEKKPLQQLIDQGQSAWLDFITRSFVRDGDLQTMIDDEGLRGMTSNPTIFAKAASDSDEYDDQIAELAKAGKDNKEIAEAIMVRDVQSACDVFRPLYDSTDGLDGFVSIEVSPGLARDTEGSLNEARRLWQSVDRPNVMVKVPGTEQGAPAVEQLLREGINVNVTLLFSVENHERVMWNYVNALDVRMQAGEPIDKVASVASFFISRVDALVDDMLDEKIEAATDDKRKQELRDLKGKAAIANARSAYARFREIFGGDQFSKLADKGAHVQRVLWGSTSTKNPDYPDVLYVEELIGPDTVNTMPQDTLEAFQDHGTVQRTLSEDAGDSRALLEQLAKVGIDYATITKDLEDEGIDKFVASYDEFLESIEQKRNAVAVS